MRDSLEEYIESMPEVPNDFCPKIVDAGDEWQTQVDLKHYATKKSAIHTPEFLRRFAWRMKQYYDIEALNG